MKPDLLLLTDAQSSETQALYDLDEPSVGQTSLVMPVGYPLSKLDGTLAIRFGEPHDENSTVVWSGSLNFPSGRVMATNASMRPSVGASIEPGSYRVEVIQAKSDVDGITIRLAAGQ